MSTSSCSDYLTDSDEEQNGCDFLTDSEEEKDEEARKEAEEDEKANECCNEQVAEDGEYLVDSEDDRQAFQRELDAVKVESSDEEDTFCPCDNNNNTNNQCCPCNTCPCTCPCNYGVI